MPEFDPDHTESEPASELPYAERLKAKNVGQVRYGNSISQTDERGHVVTRHADGRQDVTINL